MRITIWPKKERPRERLLAQGASTLSNAELLAILLRTGAKGKTALDLARELINTFGGLRPIFTAQFTQFQSILGMGPTKYAQLQAVKELAIRSEREVMERGDTLDHPLAVHNYLHAKMRSYPYEVFSCVFLDTYNRVIGFDELFRGSIKETAVYPRELLRKVYQTNASAVILAHNHPSGVAIPSEADKQLTKQIKALLSAVDVSVLDHIIIGDGQWTSFVFQGLL